MKNLKPFFHVEKNITPFEKINLGSHKKVWWKCEKGHEWLQSPKDKMAVTYDCPYCSGYRIQEGFNDLKSLYPEVAQEWNFNKNQVDINTVFPSSHKKVWWKCEKGHEWEARIDSRTGGKNGCPYCANRRTNHTNNLAISHPEVLRLWNFEKNLITPEQITYGSDRKVWWICDKNHSWEAYPYDIIRNAKNRKNILQGCPFCNNNKIVTGENDIATILPHVLTEWDYEKNISFSPETISLSSSKKVWWKCEKGHEWEASPSSRINRGNKEEVNFHRCRKCVQALTVSQGELDLAEHLHKNNIIFSTNDRTVIPPLELDIYIPEKNIAIEFNGLYWHSEAAGKTKYYHYDKWKACKDKGIQLIQVWEDEYNRNPEQVKNMLAHKLGVTNQRKVFARKTEVVHVTNEESAVFLEKNHIQGYVQGGVRLGLVDKHNGSLVAVMVLKNEPGSNGDVLNLLRYATSCSVVGGFTKLVKYVEKSYVAKKVVTFSDNAISDGSLYLKNGFVSTKNLLPDYMYISQGRRVHKFNYRLKRFREDPNLLFEEGLSERELAQLNNLPRIWDSGKIKWEKIF